MVKRILTTGVLLFSLACRTTPTPPDPTVAIAPARVPAEAAAHARTLKGHGPAAVTAWIEGNDRAYARERLNAAMLVPEKRARVALVRALLSLAEVDTDGARRDLLTILDEAPESPEAEVALLLILDQLRSGAEAAQVGARMKPVIKAGPAERTTIAAAIAARLARSEGARDEATASVARGGFLTRWRSIGPLAPIDARVFREDQPYEMNDDWSQRATFRGSKPVVRKHSRTTHGRIDVPNRPGLYVLDTYVHLSDAVDGVSLLLEAHLPASARIRMDGQLVVQHDTTHRRRESVVHVPIRANAGWHRITITTLAGHNADPAISLLDASGQSVVTKNVSSLPAQAALSMFPPAIGKPIQAEKTSAAQLVRTLVEDEGWTWFGRYLSSFVHLSGWHAHVDGAREVLFGVEDAAPKSAAIFSARARLARWAGHPSGMIQALFAEAVTNDPTLPRALIDLAASVRKDDADRALVLANRAAVAAPKSLEPLMLRFRILRQRGWSAEAVAALRELAKRDAPPGLLLEGAQLLRSLDRVREAKSLEDRAAAQSGTARPGQEANTALGRGEIARAIETLVKTGTANNLARAGALELTRGRVADARAHAQAALKKDAAHSGAVEVLLRAAVADRKLAAFDAALERLRARGNATIQHEVLRSAFTGERMATPSKKSWLGQTLVHDPWPSIRHLPGTKIPKGLDPADPRSRYRSLEILDRVVDYVRPNGQALSWRHEITRLQTKEATDRAGELRVPGDALPLTLRTLKPDGKVIEIDRHSGKDDVSFSALAPGDAVELEWVNIVGAATPWGGYTRRFYFQGTSPIERSDFVVVVPKGTKLWWHSYHGAPEPIIHEEDERTIYVFTSQNMEAFEPESHAVPGEEYLPFVAVAVDFDSDRALATNTLGLERRTRSSWDVDVTAHKIAKGYQDDASKIRALYMWVTKEIGDGRAKEPSQVLATRRGDRLGLYTAMLRAIGLDAEIVVMRGGDSTSVSPRYPTSSQFTTRAVRIKRKEGTIWALLGGRQPWLGRLPPRMRGGAFVSPSDPYRVIPVRDREVDTWKLRSNVDLEVDEMGTAAGHVEITLPGTYGAALREFLLGSRKEAANRQLQGWLAALIPGARLVDFEAANEHEPLQPYGLRVRVAIDNFMVRDGQHLVNEQFFIAPLAMRSIGMPTLGAYLRTPVRKTPMLLTEAQEEMTIAVRFPSTTTAPVETPKTFTQVLDFGQFTQAFEWDDKKKEARLVRLHAVPLRRLSPTAFGAFRESAQVILQTLRNRLIVPTGRMETAMAPRD